MAYSQDWIFKKEFLENVNSVRFSQSTDIRKEKENRFKTVWFIKDLSNALRPGPAVETPRDRKDEEADYDIRNLKVLWTACAFFHRFYVFHSFGAHQRFAVAVACLFLASKVEEKPLRLSDHIFMYFRLRKNEIVKKTDPQFKDTEKEVLLSERILLQTLGFDLNVVHPYQFFRQIIGKDLKAWFTDPEDSKQVLRLATNLLTDSYRSTLCLLYTPQQLAVGLVFLSLQIMGLKPQAPATGGGMYGSRPGYSPATVTQDGSTDQSWLELLEKDAEESVVRDICFTMVELYETSFSPADVPYAASSGTPSHAELRKGIANELDRVAALRVTAAEREGVEEHKGSVSADDLAAKAGVDGSDGSGSSSNGSSNKRKLSIDGSGMTMSGLGSITKSRYTTLPPAFSEATTTVAPGSAAKVLFPSGAAAAASLSVSVVSGVHVGSASPCVNAPTPRGYRPVSIPTNVSPESLPLPPPDSPGSAYSTFSQAHAHLHEHQYRQVSGPEAEAEASADKDDSYERLLNGSGLESPDFMPPPPPPDTPGSMASTPNFENLPRAGDFGHHLPDQFSLQHAKRPRMDY